MPTPSRLGSVTTRPRKASLELNVLLMCADPKLAAWSSDLVSSLGCTVNACSNFIELLLYLKHETFQLVVILEGERPTPGWRTAAEYIAGVSRSTPFFVINHNGEVAGLSPSVGNLN
jgi:hypothetical protein